MATQDEEEEIDCIVHMKHTLAKSSIRGLCDMCKVGGGYFIVCWCSGTPLSTAISQQELLVGVFDYTYECIDCKLKLHHRVSCFTCTIPTTSLRASGMYPTSILIPLPRSHSASG